MSNELQISEEQFRAYGIFHPYALGKTLEAQRRNQRFVYYTSADTAMRILRNGEIWMRKSHLMNDYREVEHGFDGLNESYKKNKQRMQAVFDGMFPGFCERLEAIFNSWLPHFRMDSYITCLSEHDPSEDQHGRLSMWRAYGGGAGVALVVNGGPLLRPSNALRANTSPVAYFHNGQVEDALAQILSNVEDNRDFLQSLGDQQVQANMFAALRYAILCTKHPGFHEEREWRVIYSPRFARSERITSSIESINGIPQSICRLPLRDFPEEGLYGLAPSDFVERVIIGPTKFPAGIYDAFAVLLADVGIPNPEQRIIFSAVPLRQ
ncbi:DUF2971 domain-containing protein [Bradyrhizobium sp. Arg237L]|uniref:DUF2971 domain-containing protein n=1 Tax=Bradyrhizobium sp. Arg237L TaxID=3003352 RepID=UPI00249F17D1|nr:DUF2971 domain-containing protein [Bradyrhizobium sp. Arg237L]MDI4236792.1 DUF2971 domain-containing protein [Bradyrhizobium sp. Arg237L]